MKPKYYRGTMTELQFIKLVEDTAISDSVRGCLNKFFVKGVRLSSIAGKSKQAMHQRAKYYINRGIVLGIVKERNDYA